MGESDARTSYRRRSWLVAGCAAASITAWPLRGSCLVLASSWSAYDDSSADGEGDALGVQADVSLVGAPGWRAEITQLGVGRLYTTRQNKCPNRDLYRGDVEGKASCLSRWLVGEGGIGCVGDSWMAG